MLLVDTGSPCPLIIGQEAFRESVLEEAADVMTNFGQLQGGWLHVVIDEVGFDGRVQGFASDSVVAVVKESESNFQGLVGLPLLRRLKYGGDEEVFWLRPGRRLRGREARRARGRG